ncbi:hypothetical protein ABMX90_14335 [Vibrio vulnificus]|uniref:hypothetical protein n=1 Tax=Vibrio vulnificus TaxID=672 RepID=UPI004059D9D6
MIVSGSVFCRLEKNLIFIKIDSSSLQAHFYLSGESTPVMTLWFDYSVVEDQVTIRLIDLTGCGDNTDRCNAGIGTRLVRFAFAYFVHYQRAEGRSANTIGVIGRLSDAGDIEPSTSHHRRCHFWSKFGVNVIEPFNHSSELSGFLSAFVYELVELNLDWQDTRSSDLSGFIDEMTWSPEDEHFLSDLLSFDIKEFVRIKDELAASRSKHDIFIRRTFWLCIIGVAISTGFLGYFILVKDILSSLSLCLLGAGLGAILHSSFFKPLKMDRNPELTRMKNAMTQQLDVLLKRPRGYHDYFYRLNKRVDGALSDLLYQRFLTVSASSHSNELETFFSAISRKVNTETL